MVDERPQRALRCGEDVHFERLVLDRRVPDCLHDGVDRAPQRARDAVAIHRARLGTKGRPARAGSPGRIVLEFGQAAPRAFLLRYYREAVERSRGWMVAMAWSMTSAKDWCVSPASQAFWAASRHPKRGGDERARRRIVVGVWRPGRVCALADRGFSRVLDQVQLLQVAGQEARGAKHNTLNRLGHVPLAGRVDVRYEQVQAPAQRVPHRLAGRSGLAG